MSPQMFNPDDFVFEKMCTPDERKPILEYDATNSLIITRYKNQQGEYDYESCFLNTLVNKNLLKYVPDEWSNDNDRICLFSIYEDGNYLLEKEKLKYDFSIKQTKWIRYSYSDLKLSEAKEIFEIIKAAIQTKNISEETEKNTQILKLANTETYLAEKYDAFCTLRDKILRESDWSQLPDAPETFDGELVMWTKWREKLRTLIKSPDNFETGMEYLIYIEDFTWPIDPSVYKEHFLESGVDYLETEDQYSKSIYYSIKNVENILGTTISNAARQATEELKDGVYVEKEIYKLIRKYKLAENLPNFDVNNLKIIGE